jgi:hypothetical protein
VSGSFRQDGSKWFGSSRESADRAWSKGYASLLDRRER